MNETINDTIGNGLQISRTISELGVLVVIAGIFLVLVIILFIFFIYQLINQQRKLDSQSRTLDKLLEYQKGTKANDSINTDQLFGILHRTFDRLADKSTIEALKLNYDKRVINNEVLINKIDAFVVSLFRNHKTYLMEFRYCGTLLSDYIDASWQEKLKLQLVKDMENDECNVYALETTYVTLFCEYKEMMKEKLTQVKNKEAI